MKITIVGGGAAGLSAATNLMRLPQAEVTVLERAQPGEAPGLGVALMHFSLADLRLLNAKGFPAIEPIFVAIDRVTENVAGPDRAGALIWQKRLQDQRYWGVKRASLLAFLTETALAAGARIDYGRDLGEDELRSLRAESDLLVGADGAGSVVRTLYAKDFKPTGGDAKTRYAWLELEGGIDRFVFGFIYVGGKGLLRITAYPHGKNECSAIVTHSMGLTDTFDAPEMLDGDGSISGAGLEMLNDVFSQTLRGKKLFGQSRWRRFRATHCEHAVAGNVALVGDAYATLHYETGWGTSAAMQELRILGHMLGFALGKGQKLADGLLLFDRKSAEFSRGVIVATAKTMREVDAQAARFFRLGASKFLESRNA